MLATSEVRLPLASEDRTSASAYACAITLRRPQHVSPEAICVSLGHQAIRTFGTEELSVNVLCVAHRRPMLLGSRKPTPSSPSHVITMSCHHGTIRSLNRCGSRLCYALISSKRHSKQVRMLRLINA